MDHHDDETCVDCRRRVLPAWLQRIRWRRWARRPLWSKRKISLGGAPILSGYAKLVPSGEWAKDAIGGMVDRVEKNKLVTVKTGTTVSEFSGNPGEFVPPSFPMARPLR